MSPNPAAAATTGPATSLPYYPSPWGSGAGDWADAYGKARDFVSQLTLLEKVNLTTGIGYPSSSWYTQAKKLTLLTDGKRGDALDKTVQSLD